MNIKINIVEAAAEIAEKQLKAQYAADYDMQWDNPDENRELYNMVYEENIESKTTTFTDEAQDIFNAIYDEIFDKLIDCKVVAIPNLFNSKTVFADDLVEDLATEATEREVKREVMISYSESEVEKYMWELGPLNSMVYTKLAQGIYNKYKVYYEMKLKQFEI
jgi:hypothetical protein